jgi:thiamine biosynthesis lipoprotein
MPKPPTLARPVHVHLDQNHMATTFRFVASVAGERAEAARRAMLEAHAEVARLEDLLTEFRERSPVARLNRAAPFERVAMPLEAIELLERSERFRRLSGGAFDCAAKSSDRPATGPAVGWDAVLGVAWRMHDGVRVGFGAIGKGYALDRARAVLVAHGLADFLLSAGGSSVILSGFAAPGVPWTWGWSWGRDADGDAVGLPFEHASGAAVALGISGTHEKGAHIIDARRDAREVARGTDRDGAPLSSLVAALSAADADALSTAMFVAGYERAAGFMAELPFSPALAMIDSSGTPHWNGIFKHHWGHAAARATIAVAGLASLLAAPLAGQARADEAAAIDLGAMGTDAFNPYVFDRSPYWAALPLLALAIVLIHLKKVRRSHLKSTTRASLIVVSTLLWATLEQAHAVDLVPMGKALMKYTGSPKAMSKKVDGATAVYAKDAQGKVKFPVAFIEKNVWNAQCDHTWIVAINPDGKVAEVVAQNQQCPHAKPSAANSFLDRYKGKGPADVQKLKGEIDTIAKATGSCNLATDAVIHAVNSFQKIRSQL